MALGSIERRLPTGSLHARTAALSLVLLGSACAGCSTYEERWEEAVAANEHAQGAAGAWRGTWTSEASGHTGGLRAIVTRVDRNRLHVAYHATYDFLFEWTFEYELDMDAREVDGVEAFEGEADLGWMAGGVYTYRGQADGTSFFSTYRAEDDHGTFTLARP